LFCLSLFRAATVIAPGFREAVLPAFAVSPDMGIGNSDSSGDTREPLKK